MYRPIAAICAALSLSAAGQEEMVDNPEYLAWAKQKPGAWVRWKVETQTGAMKVETEITWTLRSVTADQAVLDEKTVLNGGKTEHAGSRTIPARIRKGTTAEGARVEVLKEGEEEIPIKGRTLKCRWVDLKLIGKGGSVRIWKSDEIVGGVARTMIKHDEAGNMTMTMTAVDWKTAE